MTGPKQVELTEVSYEHIPPWELNEPSLAYTFPTDEDIDEIDYEREVDRGIY